MRRIPLVLTVLAAAALAGCRNEEMERQRAAAEASAAAASAEASAARERVAALDAEVAKLRAERETAVREAQDARTAAAEAKAAAEKRAEEKDEELERVSLHRDELRDWIEGELLPVAEDCKPELANLKAATDEMMREVARLRGLEWKHPVMRRRLRRAEVGEWMRRDMRRELPEDKARELVVVGAELGLVQPGTDLYQILGDFVEGGAGAFYKPQTRTFYHIEGNDGRGAYPIVFHELVHALEDQHFDLERVYREIGEDTDRGLARRGLVEGSAALFQAVYEEQHPADKAAMVKAQMSDKDALAKQMKMLQSVPAFLVASLGLYPYQNGMRWVDKVTGRDPRKVDALFSDMPVSTEQVLHPEKWIDASRRDWPHAVTPPSLDALPASWKRVDPDTLGELTTGCLLAQLRAPGPMAVLAVLDPSTQGLAFKAPVKDAVEGWDGDCVVGAVDPETGRATVVWVTVWDGEQDAEQFLQAYAPLLGKKVTGKKSDALPSPVRFDDPSGRASGVVREGRRVVAVLGAPPASYDALLAAALATKATPDARDAADAGN